MRSSVASKPSGPGSPDFSAGERVGIPWLGHTCGQCSYCRTDAENLCDAPGFTGYQINGGYAEYTVAEAAYCFRPARRLRRCGGCAAAVRRTDRLSRAADGRRCGPARHLRIWRGSAHRGPGGAIRGARRLCIHTPWRYRSPDLCRQLGCVWAGSSEEQPPTDLDAAIIFAPVGALRTASRSQASAKAASSSLAAST